ncbi:MAG: hypothetical protein ABSE97_01285 [Verrucomicrobiota bacterium]|jgi:hypothetical protein
MGKTKGPYNPEFLNGDTVRIVNRETLEKFYREWKYHHKLTPEQLNYHGQIAEVEPGGGTYHGGDELYKLKGIPGIWHEQCLEAYIPPS